MLYFLIVLISICIFKYISAENYLKVFFKKIFLMQTYSYLEFLHEFVWQQFNPVFGVQYYDIFFVFQIYKAAYNIQNLVQCIKFSFHKTHDLLNAKSYNLTQNLGTWTLLNQPNSIMRVLMLCWQLNFAHVILAIYRLVQISC